MFYVHLSTVCVSACLYVGERQVVEGLCPYTASLLLFSHISVLSFILLLLTLLSLLLLLNDLDVI